MTAPALLVSLTADGSLAVHLPGSVGDRVLPLRETSTIKPTETLRQLLLAQSRGELGIGQNGEPTRQQLSHMERHQIFADDRCPFCRAHDRGLAPHKSSHSFDARYAKRQIGADCQVRRLKTGDSTAKTTARAKGKAATAGRQAAKQAELDRLTISDKAKELGF
jgi:hypothetical protein